MKSFLRCGTVALPLLLGLPAALQEQTTSPHGQPGVAGPITVQHPWARASAGQSGNGAAFLSLAATGRADRLVSASTPAARRVELHETTMDGTIMRMRPVAGIDIAPGKPAELKPGGLHIMLMDLPAPLKVGESFPLTLTFANAPPLTVSVKVVPPGGAAPHGH